MHDPDNIADENLVVEPVEEVDDNTEDDGGSGLREVAGSIAEIIFPGKGSSAVNTWLDEHGFPSADQPTSSMTPLGTVEVRESKDQNKKEPTNLSQIDNSKRRIVAVLDSNIHPGISPEIIPGTQQKNVEMSSAKNVEIVTETDIFSGVIVEPTKLIQAQTGMHTKNVENMPVISTATAPKIDIFSTIKRQGDNLIIGGQKAFYGLKNIGGRLPGSTNAKAWGILLFYARHNTWPAGLEKNERMRRHYQNHDKLLLAKQFVRAERRQDHDECRRIEERALRNSTGTKTSRKKGRATRKGNHRLRTI